MAVVGYIRVSTEEQAQAGFSLGAQEDKIRAWHALHGEGRELLLFRDEGISGSRMDRPGLGAALDACGRGGVLVVYSLSRMARSTRGTLDVAEALEKRGCDLVSLSERIDTTSAAGRMMFRLLAVLAEFERELLGERTAMGMEKKRRAGGRVSRYGRVPNAVAARAAQLRAGGASLREIGRTLLEEGMRPVGGGGVWSPKVVKEVLERGAA